jgi:nucleoside 2-deoxyribosyltransferase
MNIYLASRMSRLPELNRYKAQIEALGHTVTSQWLEGKEEGLTQVDITNLDLGDIDRSDAIVLFTQAVGSSNPGGNRLIEFGYAWAKGKYLYACGERELVFLYHPDVIWCETVEELLSELEAG